MKKLFSSPQMGAHVVATVVVTGFVALVILLAVHPTEPSNLLQRAIDIVGACFTWVVSYYMGDSAGSAQKSAQISHLIGQSSAPDAATPPQA